MPDLSLLNRPLTAAENPGLDTLDPRFQEIATLVQSEQIQEAAAQVESLWQEDIYDVRLIGYHIYACFQEKGVQGLKEILDCLVMTLGDNWDAIGPVKKKEKHTKVAMKWCFSRMVKMMDYHQEKSDDSWQKWCEITSDEVQEIVDAHDAFRKAILAKIEDETTLEQVTKIGQWISEFHKIIYAQEPQEEEQVDEQPQEDEQSNKEEQTTSSSGMMVETVEGSYPLHLLVKKIEVFEQLIEKGNYSKAAIIADDINTTIENFDPLFYLPKIFARYYKVLTPSIEQVSMHWDEKGSIPWEAKARLAIVDLDSFVNDEK